MSGQLFAFRVSRPVEQRDEEPLTFVYDPHAQTAVWRGEDRALAAVSCTRKRIPGPRDCTSYSGYCNTYGPRRANGFYCDY